MNYLSSDDDGVVITQARRPHWVMGVFILTVVASVSVVIHDKFSQPKYKPFKIRADAYVWPEGCPKKIYDEYDEPPRACASEKYYYGGMYEYGLSYNRGAYYYRIDKDLVDIRCGIGFKNCAIIKIYRDIFVVPEDIK